MKKNRREYPYKRLRYDVNEALDYYDSEVISCLHLGKTPDPFRWTVFICKYSNVKNPYNGKSLLSYMVGDNPERFFKYVKGWYCMPRSWHKKNDLGLKLSRKLVRLIINNAKLDMRNDILNAENEKLKSQINKKRQ